MRSIIYKRLQVEIILFNRSTLYPILINRIGIDLFVNRITRLREAPHFKHASQYLFVSKFTFAVLTDGTEMITITESFNSHNLDHT